MSPQEFWLLAEDLLAEATAPSKIGSMDRRIFEELVEELQHAEHR